MMSTRKAGWLGVMLCLVCGLGYGANDGDKPTEVIRDEIVGVVFYPDGVTPASDLPVRVWSVDRQKMLYRTKTNREGVFRIPVLRTGQCYVFVGTVRINLSILSSQESEWHQANDLVIILPHRRLVSARPSIEPFLIGPLFIPKTKVVSP